MIENERNPSWVPLVALFLPAAQVFLLFRQIRRKAGSPLGLPAFLYDIEKGEGKWCVSLQAFCLLYSS